MARLSRKAPKIRARASTMTPPKVISTQAATANSRALNHMRGVSPPRSELPSGIILIPPHAVSGSNIDEGVRLPSRPPLLPAQVERRAGRCGGRAQVVHEHVKRARRAPIVPQRQRIAPALSQFNAVENRVLADDIVTPH